MDGRKENGAIKHILGGTLAGISGTIFGHPLDTIKVRLQTRRHLYTGMWDCFKKIVQTEGISHGLFRGMTSPMANMAVLNSIAFGLFEQCKHITAHINKTYLGESLSFKSYEPFIAGGVVGVVSSFYSTPFDVVKIQLQVDYVSENKYKGSIHCAKVLFQEHGLSVFFLGSVVNLFREVIFAAAYFGVYDTMKYHLGHMLSGVGIESPQVSILLSGGIAGMMGWGVSFPLDAIKSMQQSQPVQGITWSNRGLTTKQVLEKMAPLSITGLYRGVGPSLIRAFIVSSTRFSAYEFVVSMFNKFNI